MSTYSTPSMPSTTAGAIARAQVLARKHGESMFVVWSGDAYEVADEVDLDTWWLGVTVFCEVMPDGTYVLSD